VYLRSELPLIPSYNIDIRSLPITPNPPKVKIMDALPVAGFFAALLLTTYWFDELEDDQFGLPLQAVYAVTWGLLGAAVLLICELQSPNMVARDAALLAFGFVLGATVELIINMAKRHRIAPRNLRWLVAGIVVFASTHLLIQPNERTTWLTIQQHGQTTTKWSTASRTTGRAQTSF
jgi:hypothetical protein